jgi:hypothetical protein
VRSPNSGTIWGQKSGHIPFIFMTDFLLFFPEMGLIHHHMSLTVKNALHLTSQLMVVVFIFYSRKSGSNGIDGKKRSD